MIKVKAYADLTKYISKEQNKFETTYDNKGLECKVKDIVEFYGIPKENIKIILINGIYSDMEATVKDGDTVVFFSPVGGG